MAKSKTLFYCTACGNEQTKWVGQCPACKEWNTIVEAPEGKIVAGKKVNTFNQMVTRQTLKDVDTAVEARISTHIGELDRVLGGGIVNGSLILVGGDPGIGKSTLLLQMCKNLSDSGNSVLYVSGEESLRQIKLRADRIGTFSDELKLLCTTDVSNILSQIYDMMPKVVIIDSIQTMFNESVDSQAGSVSQVRETTQTLLRVAKEQGISIFIIGHVTKEGTVAGPRMLEHMVDTVLYFEGENTSLFRILRSVKNRFGSTNEIGVFEMMETGLREVTNPSEHMLEGMPEGEPGSVVTCVMEGTRPIMLEVQALVCQTNFNMPRRTAAGTDYNRVNLLMAVMEKRMGVHLSGCDCYINVAGGMKVNDPSLDLSIIATILSGFTNRPLPEKSIVFGEVGLTGEVRAVSNAASRVSEAIKLGYKLLIVPKACIKQIKLDKSKTDVKIIGIENVRELKDIL